jgi:hypothetical protein
MQVLRKLKTFKAAMFAGLAGLVLTTCTAAVATLPINLRDLGGNDNDSQLGSVSTPLPTPGTAIAASPPPVSGNAPAQGLPSAPVDPAQQATEGTGGAPVAPTKQAVFNKVKVQQPRLRVSGLVDPAALQSIRDMDGVRYATAFDVGRIPVGPRNTPVTVAAVDPRAFRVVTPEVTANAFAVWQRIVEGDAAFTHDTGNRLKAQLGSFVPVGTEGSTLRVGAYASNGIPPVADALVSPKTAQTLGMQGRRDALVAVKDGADPQVLAQKIRQITNAQVQLIEQPQARRAFLTGADAKNAFEPFNYIDMGDGMIQIDPAWVARNIVRRPMPLLKGEVVCHRLMVNQLYGALKEIEDSGLGHLIDPSQYGGCWVPRHIDFNPSKPLSMHGWGLAADFNVSTNGLGAKPQMDPRIVAIFDRWGFVWGGRWSRPDGMHFELGALVQNSPQG